MLSIRNHFRPQDICRLKVRGWTNILHANGKQNKTGVAIFISDKTDLKIKMITRNKDTTLIDQGINPRRRHNNCKYLCIQQRSTSIHKTNTDIKGEIDSNTVIIGDLNTPLPPMDISSKLKIKKKHKS